MRVFIAGATGAVDRRLVPLALRAGHQLTGTTRSEDKAGALDCSAGLLVIKSNVWYQRCRSAVGGFRTFAGQAPRAAGGP